MYIRKLLRTEKDNLPELEPPQRYEKRYELLTLTNQDVLLR